MKLIPVKAQDLKSGEILANIVTLTDITVTRVTPLRELTMVSLAGNGVHETFYWANEYEPEYLRRKVDE